MEIKILKRVLFFLFVVSMISIPSVVLAESAGAGWMVSPLDNDENYREKEWIASDENRVFEVLKSRVSLALSELEEKSFIAIEEPLTLEYFLGTTAPCLKSMPEGYHPYLLRAVYSSANGGFRVGVTKDRSTFVVYEQLGAIADIHRTALVVYLQSKPIKIYPTIHSIM